MCVVNSRAMEVTHTNPKIAQNTSANVDILSMVAQIHHLMKVNRESIVVNYILNFCIIRIILYHESMNEQNATEVTREDIVTTTILILRGKKKDGTVS